MVTQSWFHNLWPRSKKQEPIGVTQRVTVLTFEAASLMAKLIHLWQSLSDKQVAKLRDEVSNSVGIRNLVSGNEDFIVGLICSEMTENVVHVAMAVSRLSKKCNDPLLRSFDRAFNDLMRNNGDAYGWRFSWKKMEKKIKKMERFVGTNNNLYQAMETVADLEQALKRMKGSDAVDSITLVEYEKRVVSKRQEVKRLKESSLWSRTYDYTVLLLARSLFTVYDRIGHVFGTNGVEDDRLMDTNYNHRRGHSTIFLQSSVYPSENCVPKHSSGVPGKFVSMSGPLTGKNIPSDFRSGPLARSMAASSPISENYSSPGFFSGPLMQSTTASSEPVLKPSKSGFRLWQFRYKSHDGGDQKITRQKSKAMIMSGPLTGAGGVGAGFPMGDGYSIDVCASALDGNKDATEKPRTQEHMSSGDRLFVASRNKLLNPPPETLGASALALHYANVIVFIEKLVSSPRLLGQDARDDLYNMLPSSVRKELRAKLRPGSESQPSSPYPASEHNESISEILEWLGPLAHNMIRWQSMRSIEHQSFISKANVLLVQTLFFANQEKTEETIVRLLVGLNNIWRFGRETEAMAPQYQVHDGRLD